MRKSHNVIPSTIKELLLGDASKNYPVKDAVLPAWDLVCQGDQVALRLGFGNKFTLGKQLPADIKHALDTILPPEIKSHVRVQSADGIHKEIVVAPETAPQFLKWLEDSHLLEKYGQFRLTTTLTGGTLADEAVHKQSAEAIKILLKPVEHAKLIVERLKPVGGEPSFYAFNAAVTKALKKDFMCDAPAPPEDNSRPRRRISPDAYAAGRFQEGSSKHELN